MNDEPLDGTMTLTSCLVAIRELDALGRSPIAVKLNPLDIEALQRSAMPQATYAVASPTALPAGCGMRLAGVDIYPDADVPRGEPRWVYAADEVQS